MARLLGRVDGKKKVTVCLAGPLDHLIGRVVDVWEKRATVCLAGPMGRRGRVVAGWVDCLAEPGKEGTVRSRKVRAGCSAGPLKVAVGLDEVLDSEG